MKNKFMNSVEINFPTKWPPSIRDKLRSALRSIIRGWRLVTQPLRIEESNECPISGAQKYRIPDACSHEELQERLLEFAGRAWQLKDGLIRWLKEKPDFEITFEFERTKKKVSGTGGIGATQFIESAAKMSIELMLCADLYNSHKHYGDCNRSNYQPFLSGIQLDTSKSGLLGISDNGNLMENDLTVENPVPVKYRIELMSFNHPVNFGDASVAIGRAFKFWLPLIKNVDLLSWCCHEEKTRWVDKPLLDELEVFERELEERAAFANGSDRLVLDDLPLELHDLHMDDPAKC